jgi:hypothetical protein
VTDVALCPACDAEMTRAEQALGDGTLVVVRHCSACMDRDGWPYGMVGIDLSALSIDNFDLRSRPDFVVAAEHRPCIDTWMSPGMGGKEP